jgi:hypothetical protein
MSKMMRTDLRMEGAVWKQAEPRRVESKSVCGMVKKMGGGKRGGKA